MRRISNELKKQRGTAQPSRLVPEVSSLSKITKLPPVPVQLKGYAADVYNTIGLQICQLSMLTVVDMQLFVQYCFYMGEWLKLAEDIAINGSQEEKLNWQGMYVSQTRNEYKLMNENRKMLDSIETKIGLDPLARDRLLAVLKLSENKTETKNPFLA